MKFSRLPIPLSASMLLIAAYLAAAWYPSAPSQIEIRDFLECFIPLFANAFLLWNAATECPKQNVFWKLLALSCTLLLIGRLIATYDELILHRSRYASFASNVFPFLHMIPLVAAAALAPHRQSKSETETLRYGLHDLLLFASFGTYLYVFTVIPWQVASPNEALFHQSNAVAFTFLALVVTGGFAFLGFTTTGTWRFIYGNVAGSTALYSIAPLLDFQLNIGNSAAVRGTCYVLALIWLAITAASARSLPKAPTTGAETAGEAQWQGWFSVVVILSFPALGAWAMFGGNAPYQVRMFRLVATFAGIFVCSGLAFYRQHLAHTERARLVRQLSTSLENVQRLQTQFVQSEKLAALGQLAAGAAHEINNPLSAIVGYADLLLTENAPTTRSYTLGQKIHDQARRTTALVTNLLSFARQVPAEKQLLDLHTVLESAVRLRKIDAHNRNIRVELEGRNTVLPAVRGDPNQLLQVFHHLLGNAVDAMEETGGVLLVRSLAEKGGVVIEFSDTGPGMKEPERVFDPFYTTKPIGKATGLGLSISYGIIQEHGGAITGFNRPEGGCTFRIELPAALASLPRMALAPVAQRNS